METITIPFNYGELEIPKAALNQCYHQGQCDDDVKEWEPLIDWESQTLTSEGIKIELSEYGAWSDDELNDEQANQERILWIAAGNFHDGMYD